MEGQKRTIATLLGLFLAVILAAAWYIHGHDVAVLNPKGTIAAKERRLIIESTLLMLIVVIPVYVLMFFITWRYREGNTKAKYSPDLDGNRFAEGLWWAVPMAIITCLAVLAWRSSHQLDPFKALTSSTTPIQVEVVALEWKWLFIYPKQNVASVNLLEMPVNTPVNFEITADAPMNSFWIPQLGGQIYAMSGMSTQLHLMATSTGDYYGSSANISGRGFAGMHFTARAAPASDFNKWLKAAAKSSQRLSLNAYNQLAAPTENNPATSYSNPQADLYPRILAKFAHPAPSAPGVDYYVASSEVE